MGWSPDGGVIAVTTNRGVALIDAASLGELAFKATEYGRRPLAFSEDGARLATADGLELGRSFRVWEARDLALLGEYSLPGPGDFGTSAMKLGFLTDDEIVLAVGELSGLGVWITAPDGSMNHVLTIEGAEPLMAALSPSSDMVAVSVGPAQAVRVWRLRTDEMLEEVPVEGSPELQITGDGRFLVAMLGSTVVWDLAAGRSIVEIPVSDGIAANHRIPYSVAISHDDRLLASDTEIPAPGVGIWELATGELAGMLAHEELERIVQISFSPANHELALLLNDGRLQVWRIGD